MKRIKSLRFIAVMILYLQAGSAGAQESQPQMLVNPADSLTFSEVLKQVLATYPSVLKAQEAIHAADAAVGMARSAYYPNIEADAGYAFMAPVPNITIPDAGTFDLYPMNNYNITAMVQQMIYDFSRTRRNVDVELSAREITEKNVNLVKQRLTLVTAVSYYTMIYLQEAIRIKEMQIDNLNQHLDFITRKEQTGSATRYEILSTKVRLSNAETQKVDLQTSLNTQISVLNSLMGLPMGTSLKVRKLLELSEPGISSDSLLSYAMEHRYEMVVARLRENHAELRLNAAKAMDFPSLNAFADGGFKNGYIPDLNKFTPNVTLGVGLKVPIFDATRKKNTILLAKSNIGMVQQEAEQTSRDISVEVTQNEVALKASVQKIQQGKLQVSQASDALDLANTSFQNGVITNLDLLDAETALEESRINLLRARTEYAINVIRLNLSLGEISW
jgi:outer membrane protein